MSSSLLANDGEGVLPLCSSRHRVQDVGDQLPDQLQGSDPAPPQQGQDEAPRS